MRHGGRTNFTGNGALLKVADGDIAPDIAIKIDQDIIKTTDDIEQLGNIVVWFNLCGVRIESQPQPFNKGFGIGRPIDLRIGGQMSIIVTNRPVDFT